MPIDPNLINNNIPALQMKNFSLEKEGTSSILET